MTGPVRTTVTDKEYLDVLRRRALAAAEKAVRILREAETGVPHVMKESLTKASLQADVITNIWKARNG